MADTNPVQVQKFLSGMDYPASRDDILQHARAQGADDNVMSTLERLPSQSFQTPADLSQAIGDMH